ncbi:unnamed protein product [Cuscuta epithymum]|uniref:Pectin acetylesterase n=1 Tax=Cuscuta epithymum TaxID=186058 RepID=A0AAV0F4E0_9ASTE|nr:unnamed protein product [Cuscuta epithymum]
MEMSTIMFYWFLLCAALIVDPSKADKNVTKTLIPSAVAEGAVCLDGSPPAYHYDAGKGSGARNWLVHLGVFEEGIALQISAYFQEFQMDQNIPCPPPVNRSLLTLPLRAHRADRVWYEPDYIDSCLKCVNCPSAAFQDEERDERVVNTLAYAGFLGVEHIARMKLDHSLISALVERWRPETHTFHLPFGEVGISLQDVAMILGLPIRGMPLSGPTIRDKAEWMNLCTQSCGFTPIASDIRTSDIMMSAITRLPIVPYSTDEEVEQHTRSLIWQLLGGFLFPDTSATRIRLYFLEVLQGDLALTRRWSWGSAVLGHLYHNLCNGAKWGTKQVGGCMHLLQIWAWSRISMLRPSVLQVIQHDHLPYGCRYVANYIFAWCVI